MTPRSILVLCTRRLGDVLLSTALIRSLRLAYPQATIDVLSLQSSAAALEGNPDIRRVLTLPAGAGIWQSLKAIGGVRRYDLALALFPDDRPQLLAFCAAGVRVNVVPATGGGWKRMLAQKHAEAQTPRIHMAEQFLRLADALGIQRQPSVVPPRPANLDALDRLLGSGWQHSRYAVLHPVPLYSYKSWAQQGWLSLIDDLAGRGLRVVLSAGPAAAERSYVDELAKRCAPGTALVNLAGQLKFCELTPLIEHAQIFVGPDTSVTHLAAATATPTIALFGPTPPVNWGPWPQGYRGGQGSPWINRAPLQHEGNVWIVQGITPCMPCGAEGCDRHLNSRSLCLDQMPASRVIAVLEQALLHAAPAVTSGVQVPGHEEQ